MTHAATRPQVDSYSGTTVTITSPTPGLGTWASVAALRPVTPSAYFTITVTTTCPGCGKG